MNFPYPHTLISMDMKIEGGTVNRISQPSAPLKPGPTSTSAELSSSVLSLSLLVASQQSKTALAKFKRRGVIERRLLAADELDAESTSRKTQRHAFALNSARVRALAGMATRLQAQHGVWRLQAERRLPFGYANINATPSGSQDDVLQASWLVVPALTSLCSWATHPRDHIGGTTAMVPPSVTEQPQVSTHEFRPSDSRVELIGVESHINTSNQIKFGDGGNEELAPAQYNKDALPCQWQTVRPFDSVNSPLADLRAVVFHPQFSYIDKSDICRAPLAGSSKVQSWVDPTAPLLSAEGVGSTPFPSSSSQLPPASLPPAVVLYVAEFIAELLEVPLPPHERDEEPEPDSAAKPKDTAVPVVRVSHQVPATIVDARHASEQWDDPLRLVFDGRHLIDPTTQGDSVQSHIFFSDGRTHQECMRHMILGTFDSPSSAAMLRNLSMRQSLLFLYNTSEQVRNCELSLILELSGLIARSSLTSFA